MWPLIARVSVLLFFQRFSCLSLLALSFCSDSYCSKFVLSIHHSTCESITIVCVCRVPPFFQTNGAALSLTGADVSSAVTHGDRADASPMHNRLVYQTAEPSCGAPELNPVCCEGLCSMHFMPSHPKHSHYTYTHIIYNNVSGVPSPLV